MAVVVALAGEHIAAVACEGVQLSQQIHRLHGHGHHVRLSVFFLLPGTLHLFAGNGPQAGIQIQLGPFHHAQIAGALVQQGCQQQGGAHQRPAFVGMHGPQQLAKALGLDDGCRVLCMVRGEAAFQAFGNVAPAVAGGG